MRLSFALYTALYVVAEMIGHQLSLVGWPQITPLLLATAVTDALLVLAVAGAVIVGADVTRHRWQPALHAWLHRRGAAHDGWWGPDAPLDVASWRPEPLALTGAPAAAPGPARPARPAPVTYTNWTYGIRPFPEEPGRLL